MLLPLIFIDDLTTFLEFPFLSFKRKENILTISKSRKWNNIKKKTCQEILLKPRFSQDIHVKYITLYYMLFTRPTCKLKSVLIGEVNIRKFGYFYPIVCENDIVMYTIIFIHFSGS